MRFHCGEEWKEYSQQSHDRRSLLSKKQIREQTTPFQGTYDRNREHRKWHIRNGKCEMAQMKSLSGNGEMVHRKWQIGSGTQEMTDRK